MHWVRGTVHDGGKLSKYPLFPHLLWRVQGQSRTELTPLTSLFSLFPVPLCAPCPPADHCVVNRGSYHMTQNVLSTVLYIPNDISLIKRWRPLWSFLYRTSVLWDQSSLLLGWTPRNPQTFTISMSTAGCSLVHSGVSSYRNMLWVVCVTPFHVSDDCPVFPAPRVVAEVEVYRVKRKGGALSLVGPLCCRPCLTHSPEASQTGLSVKKPMVHAAKWQSAPTTSSSPWAVEAGLYWRYWRSQKTWPPQGWVFPRWAAL